MDIKIKIVIRFMIFLILFLFLLVFLGNVFMPGGDVRVETRLFAKEPANSIDVLFLGSSVMLRGITPMPMWNEYGITGYSRASTFQSPLMDYYLLEDALRTQKPKVVVFSLGSLEKKIDFYVEKEASVRTALDCLPLSPVKIRAAMDFVNRSENQSVISYVFPLFRYHDRYKNMSLVLTGEEKENAEVSYKKGYAALFLPKTVEYVPKYMARKGNKITVAESSTEYFRKMVKLCERKKIEVLFMTPPTVIETIDLYESYKNFADELNVPYLDYNLEENLSQLDLDLKVDFLDRWHLSARGAEKVTIHLGKYLQDNYHIEDKRSDPRFAVWNEMWEKYTNTHMFVMCLENTNADTYQFVLRPIRLLREDIQVDWSVYQGKNVVTQSLGSNELTFEVELKEKNQYTVQCNIKNSKGEILQTLNSKKINVE